MDIHEVLFPTDFSPASELAGRVAAEMARSLGARLHVLHVVPPVTDPSLPAEWLAAAGVSLGEGGPCETALLSGRAAVEIVGYARARAIDLIVMGTHGRTGLRRAVLGSVAEHVVRTAPCLVLTVPPAVRPHAAEGARAEAGGAEAPPPAVRRCIVCAGEAPDLVCEACRTRIRGEALERKIEAERPGRRGSPA